MAETARRLWTLEEFLAFDDGTDTRYQLFDGEIVAMTPPARAHAVLSTRLARILGNGLQPPCEAAGEAGIVPPNRPGTWYQADLVVTCSPGAPTDQFIAEPVLIIEILSPSTATVDRGRKLPDYRDIPSVKEILLVSSTEARIEHWRRHSGAWTVQDLREAASLRLDAFQITIDLQELYDGLLPAEGAV